MKRFYTLLYVCACVMTMSAQIKPRNGYDPEHPENSFTVYGGGSFAMEQDVVSRRAVGSAENASLNQAGSPRIPVILVQFTDLRFISGLPEGSSCQTADDAKLVNEFFDKFCNGVEGSDYWEEGGSYGAIAEYFRDQSNGLFTPEFEVIGPVTLNDSYAYYGKDSGSSKDVNVSVFFKEAIIKAQEMYSSWNEFDNNSDGKVDMAFFIYAGEGQNGCSDKNTIWPKEVASGGTINGVTYGCYACCNEVYHGITDGVGVFVHELSHAMGLPDFYDYGYIAYGLDYWDVMDSGGYCNSGYTPCGYSAYEKDFMGWQPLVKLDFSQPQHLVLQPLHNGGNGYKIVNPNDTCEYYIIENRQAQSWDSYLGRGTAKTKNHGLLVTHVDYNKSAWSGNSVNKSLTHQRMSIIPANNELCSYMFVHDMDTYNKYMTTTTSNMFPGRSDITSLDWQSDIAYSYLPDGEEEFISCVFKPVYNTTFNCKLLNIVEREDGVVELDFCPNGELPDAVEIVNADGKTGFQPVLSIDGKRVGTTDANGNIPAALKQMRGIYIINNKKFVIK